MLSEVKLLRIPVTRPWSYKTTRHGWHTTKNEGVAKEKNLSQYDLGGGLCSDWYSLRSSLTTNGLVFKWKNRVSEIKSENNENILFSGGKSLTALLLNLLLILLEAFFSKNSNCNFVDSVISAAKAWQFTV